jgi:hypothetical protein
MDANTKTPPPMTTLNPYADDGEQYCVGIDGGDCSDRYDHGCEYSSFTYIGCKEGWGVKGWQCQKCIQDLEPEAEEDFLFNCAHCCKGVKEESEDHMNGICPDDYHKWFCAECGPSTAAKGYNIAVCYFCNHGVNANDVGRCEGCDRILCDDCLSDTKDCSTQTCRPCQEKFVDDMIDCQPDLWDQM